MGALIVAILLSQTTYVNDPLTAATFGGRGSRGGGFTATGWTTTGEPDALWYEIADALPSARIEYTVTGLAIGPGASLSGVDHDLLTVYQAPTGLAEPIAYTPGFRNNDFKAFTRIFGNKETGREGAMKFELASCPRGDPWYHDSPCPAGCEQAGIAYANGVAQNVGWNAANSYRMVLEWGNGKMSFFRDGVLLGSLTYSGTYAPQPLRVRFGSPRHDGIYPGEAMMPIGITFKDVLITGTAGTRTDACGQTAPDAGTPVVDAGKPPSGTDGGTLSQSYAALADVTAASFAAGVFADDHDLNVEGNGTAAEALVYLRFPALTGTVKKATLRLHATTSASAAGGSGTICSVADTTWSETALTWANRPPVGTSCAGAVTEVTPDADTEWDVTAIAKPGVVQSFAIVSLDPNGAHFMAKELDALKGPKLIVDYLPGTGGGAGGGGGSGGGSGSGGSGAAGGGGAGGAGGSAGGTGGAAGAAGGAAGGGSAHMEAASGCGCASAPVGLWACLFGLIALRRRR